MNKHANFVLYAKEQFMQIAQQELDKFERAEREIRKSEIRERASSLGIPLDLLDGKDG